MAMNRNWIATLQADEAQAEHLTWVCPGIPCPVGSWLDCGKIDYLVCQVEKAPKTGKIHLHAYCQFSQNMRLSALKKINARADWEPRRGTHEQARDYCKKDKSRVNGPWELGHEKNQPGKRTDWAAVSEKIKQGCTKKQVLLDHPHLAPCVRGIDALLDAHRPEPPLQRDIRVFFLYGATGMGKTHRAMIAFPKAFVIKGKYYEGKSFDRYEGQDVLILDEWDPYQWDLTLMNSLLDKWPCPLQCRYQNKDAAWTTVVICSNTRPDQCYQAVNALQKATFQRRITFPIEIVSQELPVVDFGLVAPVPTVPLDDSIVPATPPFTPSPHSPRRQDPDCPPTRPWPVVLPEKEKVKDVIDLCDPDLVFDE